MKKSPILPEAVSRTLPSAAPLASILFKTHKASSCCLQMWGPVVASGAVASAEVRRRGKAGERGRAPEGSAS